MCSVMKFILCIPQLVWKPGSECGVQGLQSYGAQARLMFLLREPPTVTRDSPKLYAFGYHCTTDNLRAPLLKT